MHKKIICVIAASSLLTTALFCGCGSNSNVSTEDSVPQETELTVFAAASLTETLTEIGALYETEHPEIKVVYNFDSSGKLKTQIEEGAVCDVFLSAAQKQMNELDIEADETVNPDRLDFVLSESRCDLLENKVALVVPEGNPKNITSFSDLPNCDLIALGNDDVPVGQYSTEILTQMEILDTLEQEGKISYGSNVKEVTAQVTEASVDCGIVYATDAFSADLEVVDVATKEMCQAVIYPAAVMKNSEISEKAQTFLDFLKTDACKDIFESVGFSMVNESI